MKTISSRGCRAGDDRRRTPVLHKDEAFALWLICGARLRRLRRFPQADARENRQLARFEKILRRFRDAVLTRCRARFYNAFIDGGAAVICGVSGRFFVF
jgi:hypothetical protein